MNKFLIIALVVILAITGFFLYKKNNANQTAELTGTVTYKERIALPKESIIEVQIRDVSLQDVPSILLADTTITTAGENVPVPFSISYNPKDINPSNTYSVSARITLPDGQLRWITDTHVSFLENGIPSSYVELNLVSALSNAGTVQKTTETNTSVTEIKGSEFRLVSFNDTQISQDQNFTLTFGDEYLSAGFCNTMNGAYSIQDNKITASQLISTLMFCGTPDNLMDMEASFGRIMSEGVVFSFENSELTLIGADGTTMKYVLFLD